MREGWIQNPILRGFNPDPSVVRVGFEWFPGVQIHHSRDLVHWRVLTLALRRASLLNTLLMGGLVSVLWTVVRESVARVGLEWFPGVQVDHSRDLVHWRLLTQLNMLMGGPVKAVGCLAGASVLSTVVRARREADAA